MEDVSHLSNLDIEIRKSHSIHNLHEVITTHIHNTTSHSLSTFNYYLHQQQLKIHPDFQYNKHNESIFDDEKLFPSLTSTTAKDEVTYDHSHNNAGGADDVLVKFDNDNPDMINCATLRALIVQLTSPEVIDYNLVCDFFLTYRMFSTSSDVMDLLLTRLIWSLQYINSESDTNIKLGKLVLLRTFVVLRHWIINYFVDDFEENSYLCDLFSTTLNKITGESNLVHNQDEEDEDHSIFISKILGDLKMHWLNLQNQFWSLGIELDAIIASHDIINYELPSYPHRYNKLSKSNTELSLHTNPSYRRSAMLSLYNQKAMHKIPIFDDSPKENPQYSVNNLFLQHRSSRVSITNKLQQHQNRAERNQYQIKHSSSVQLSPPAPVTPPRQVRGKKQREKKISKSKHLHIKDSALDLKKTKTVRKQQSLKAIPTISENKTQELEDEVEEHPTHVMIQQISPDPFSRSTTPQSIETYDQAGFSTNGNIKLPTSQIVKIVPPTPAKKMDFVLVGSGITSPVASPKRKRNNSNTTGCFKPPVVEPEFVRKNSVKKLMEGFKKTLVNHNSGASLTSNTSQVTETGHSEHEGINKLITNANNDMDGGPIGNRVDVLSARIIDELEFLIHHYMRNESAPNLTIHSPEHKDEFEEVDLDSKKSQSIQDISVMDINNLSELNIHKIDNLINDNDPIQKSMVSAKLTPSNENILDTVLLESNQSSFRKAASINWNDEGNLNFDHSKSEEVLDSSSNVNVNGFTSASDEKASFIDAIDDLEDMGGIEGINDNADDDEFEFSNHHENTRTLAPERITQPRFSFEQGVESSTVYTSSGNFSQYDVEIADLGIALSPQQMNQNKRISILSRGSYGSALKRDSVKSYISYDSAFSITNDSRHSANYDPNDCGLKKKTGFNNLRYLNNDNRSNPIISSVNNGVVFSQISRSTSKSSRKSVGTRFSTLCALTELPFNELDTTLGAIQRKSHVGNFRGRGSRSSTDMAESSIFSIAMKSNKSNSIKNTTHKESLVSSSSTKNSVAIPGISHYVLKELAAIPDETIQSTENPIEFAFLKLEGKSSSKSVLKGNEEKAAIDVPAPQSDDQLLQVDQTEDILDAIHNANTEDAIGSPDISEKELPLTATRQNTENEVNTTTILEGPLVSTPYQTDNEEEEDDNNNIDIVGPTTSTPIKDNSNAQYEYTNTFADDDDDDDDIDGFNFSQPMMPSSHNLGYDTPKTILDNYEPSKEVLSVEEIMHNNTHISFVLSYDSKSLADHFTVIERDMLQEIDWRELIELKWNKELTPVNSWLEIIVNDNYYDQNKGVNLVIARFNLMVNWIISEILLTKDHQERINIISRFIHIAQNCYALQNYSTLMQIILALTSERVQKLKSTWRNLSPGDILMHKNLEEIASPFKNFLNLRLSINQMKPSRGCIPFMGLYLSDLTFNAERPGIIKRHDEGHEHLINFSKFRTSVHVVKSLSQCIEWSGYYDIRIQRELLSKCLYIRSLDEEEMNYCLQVLHDS
ncbi:uncharacterized protein SPAPADRAFT_66123 [Spathaspora passalidarum NRRL Y-27907]|uniref:Ras GEF n=1 Tax=Spathaspora passalidarum (strain NRRL Y-27907 / 11-Y1) TaxID=619300 RepID=G3AL80_SPAPN|nr:uncharacterized protein SPAPADRAFT_66123 [Spathaspora passalidarum NRRL Y-27907]EGW33123.1 hypothetical protein SPAPADRAFT_66123 [Spathaspora passalidarum NRRL Y-27907]